jgi:tetratricopeptide (TPR) repeat protein
MANEWYRKNTWTKNDEDEFFSKLKKSRTDFNKAQYLYIQAITLYSTKNIKLLNVSLMLLDKLFTDYPDEIFIKISAFKLLGDIYCKMKKYEIALENYNSAIELEEKDSGLQTQAYIHYSELVICLNKIELFEKAETLLLKKSLEMDFPIHKYKINAILAIINKQKNNLEKAKYYKELAEEAVNSTDSGFRWHKKLGLVIEKSKTLDKLMKEIK